MEELDFCVLFYLGLCREFKCFDADGENYDLDDIIREVKSWR